METVGLRALSLPWATAIGTDIKLGCNLKRGLSSRIECHHAAHTGGYAAAFFSPCRAMMRDTKALDSVEVQGLDPSASAVKHRTSDKWLDKIWAT